MALNIDRWRKLFGTLAPLAHGAPPKRKPWSGCRGGLAGTGPTPTSDSVRVRVFFFVGDRSSRDDRPERNVVRPKNYRPGRVREIIIELSGNKLPIFCKFSSLSRQYCLKSYFFVKNWAPKAPENLKIRGFWSKFSCLKIIWRDSSHRLKILSSGRTIGQKNYRPAEKNIVQDESQTKKNPGPGPPSRIWVRVQAWIGSGPVPGPGPGRVLHQGFFFVGDLPSGTVSLAKFSVRPEKLPSGTRPISCLIFHGKIFDILASILPFFRKMLPK